jgi:hypothetical protein
LLGLTIFLIGALLAGAQSSLLPLAAIFYPAVCRAINEMKVGIARIKKIPLKLRLKVKMSDPKKAPKLLNWCFTRWCTVFITAACSYILSSGLSCGWRFMDLSLG